METATKTNGKAAQGVAAVKPKEAKPPAQKGMALPTTDTPAENGKPEAEKPLSVEDKIKKVNALNDSIDKRRILKNHLERVEALKFGDYEEKDVISITGGASGTYQIKSTSLCQMIRTMLREEISAKIEEVEAEISF